MPQLMKLSFLFVLVGLSAGQEPVKVSVYYESKCPDSMAFISTQLWPTYQQVPDIFTVQFIPYGFENQTADGDSFDFNCQHGPEECVGNLIHSCALKYYPENIDNVPFISCSMSQADPPAACQQCAIQYSLDWNTIDACANGVEGPQLLNQNGILTSQVSPPLYWMPTVLINDEFTLANQAAATHNFLKLVCDTYTGVPPPQCSQA